MDTIERLRMKGPSLDQQHDQDRPFIDGLFR